MRWRTATENGEDRSSAETLPTGGHDNDALPSMSSSMDDDEPDSSSQDPVHADGGAEDQPRHGRLGTSELDLPPSAGRLLEKENLSLEEEKKQSEQQQQEGDKDPPPREEESSKKKALTPASNQADPDLENEEEQEDGLDHSQPPDDSSETDTQATPWKPQTTQSTCEFTHTIVNYSQKRESGCKKAEYSATTVDEFGNRWRLIVYVNGNGRASNHHLSLFLQVADADDLPFGWKKAVSYVLTLEHPSGSNLSYAKRNPDKTFKLCPKAIDWGWSQFITSDRIQQEGFVSNNSLTVRASVTVKSSSVSIDAEDAELYLKCAVEEGDAEAVKLCLAQGASVNCKFKDDLYTPLHTACSSGTNGGSMEVLNLLLERGADGNACNKWRETPLLIAANNGHRAAVEALLKHGADPSLCSEAGWSALTFAAHKGYDDIVALLLRAGAPVNCRVTEDSSTPLHKACAGSKPGHLSAVKQLLEGGADVHALNKWRETPLLTAANHGQAGAVEALLRSGADPCKCTDTGWSPLSIAAYKGHDGVVKLLLEEGAPTEEADPTLSAVLQAATKGLPDTVELLLRHGADHTVTTKKGDTALSILVEQNLIDAAVEMVTEYKASIPRCSRDRKKVQRARLLINLRMKQHQRDGKHVSGTEDDDETDEEEDGSKSPQHDNDDSLTSGSGPDNKKEKKKGKKSKLTLEEQARQAEEALLLELEQEDAKAKKEEAEANSKRAKKKKKKERERQQKLKEEQERREKEEKEAQERERIRKEKEERERKERQQKLKEQREREMKEAAERERIAAAKRKEKEGKERKQLEQEQKQKAKQEKKVTAATSPSGSVASDNRNKMAMAKAKVAPNKKVPVNNTTTDRNGTTERAIKKQMPAAKAQAPQGAMSQPVVQGKNRGWETKAKPAPNQAEPAKPAPAMKPISKPDSSNKGTPRGFSNEPRTPILPPPTSADSAIPSTFLASSTSDFPSGQAGSAFAFDKSASSETPYLNSMGTKNQSPPALNPDTFSNAVDRGLPLNFNVGSVEHPAVGLYRHEKVTELLQRCRMSVGVVDELALRRVFYRWIVRASHSQSPYLDCIIPSWADFEQLAAFFQRQFITESRKGTRGSGGADMVNMETLREAGSSMANVCHSQAKEVVQFRLRMEQQLPRDWNDASLGMRASDIRNNGGIGVVVDWAGQSKLYFSAEEFTTLRTRYVGQPNRFLTSIFAVKTRYETKRMVMGDTNLDFRLSLETKRCLSAEASVSAEFCADPVSALTTNVFWGNFEDVDSPFGGLVPFAKDDAGSEELLYRHGGSVSVLLPFDNMVASKYTRQMLDILQECDAKGTPISFVVFVHADSFHDLNGPPTIRDLHLLDPRLGVNYSYLRQVEALSPSQHLYFSGEGTGVSKISPEGGLIMLLQNDSAKQSYPVSEASLAKIKHSMSTVVPAPAGLLSPIGFSGEFVPRESPTTPQSGYFDALPPISPTPQHQPQPQTAMMDFGTIGGSDIQKAFSPTETSRRAAPRRGRLFELVDDGEEEHLNDVDVVSGMLNNLNVDLFQNNVSQDVDIEAISLMGIGGPPSTRSLPPGNSHSTGRYG